MIKLITSILSQQPNPNITTLNWGTENFNSINNETLTALAGVLKREKDKNGEAENTTLNSVKLNWHRIDKSAMLKLIKTGHKCLTNDYKDIEYCWTKKLP